MSFHLLIKLSKLKIDFVLKVLLYFLAFLLFIDFVWKLLYLRLQLVDLLGIVGFHFFKLLLELLVLVVDVVEYGFLFDSWDIEEFTFSRCGIRYSSFWSILGFGIGFFGLWLFRLQSWMFDGLDKLNVIMVFVWSTQLHKLFVENCSLQIAEDIFLIPDVSDRAC